MQLILLLFNSRITAADHYDNNKQNDNKNPHQGPCNKKQTNY